MYATLRRGLANGDGDSDKRRSRNAVSTEGPSGILVATRNFPDDELRCKCGDCDTLPDEEFQVHLQQLRDHYDKPMPVTSGARCPAYDETKGGMGGHVEGAVDIGVHGSDAWWLVRHAMRLGWTGIGLRQHGPINRRFVHLDRREHAAEALTPWVWTYDAEKKSNAQSAIPDSLDR
jgi:uncharacterized protein YcbK (DUF882 family)